MACSSNAPSSTPPALTAALSWCKGTTSRSGMPHTSRCNVSTAWNPPASVIDRTVIAAIVIHSTTTPRDVARKILRRAAGKSRTGVAWFLSNERGELSGKEEEGQEEEVAPTEQMLERGDGSQSRRRVFFFACSRVPAPCPALVRYI